MGGWLDRGCVAQVFAERQVSEKCLANGKDVFFAFMDLEKTYDTINRVAIAKTVHGVGGTC